VGVLPGPLDELISAAGPATLFVCGNAANETDLLDPFDRVFLLAIDEPTMMARLDGPGGDNDFGRMGDTRKQLRRWRPVTRRACAISMRRDQGVKS
jgi:hypothetical protein